MKLDISKLTDSKGAYIIAKGLPDFFTPSALKKVKQALDDELAFEASLDGNVVGFLTIREANNNVVELTWMGVKKEFQNKGVGTKLLNYALDTLKDKYKVAYGKTLSDSMEDKGYSNTRSFWMKNGFYPLETIDPYPGWDAGNPCLIFAKPL